MAGTQPVAVYALRIPPGDILVPAVPSAAAMFRLTMAAIDPTEEPEVEASESKKPRATLKVVRVPADMLDDDDSDEEDYEDIDSDEEDSDDEGVNGGPSEKKIKSKIAFDDEDSDSDEEDDAVMDDAEAQAVLAKLMAANAKGKAKALDADEDDDDEDEDLDDLGMDECVLCTLDAEKQYQQPLDFVVAEGEKVFFKVSGNLTVHLTGNYVMPLDEPSDDEEGEEGEYDLSPDEEEDLDGLDALLNGGDESDDLDDLEDPRVMEVDTDEEEQKKPKAAATKGKNKRPAEDDEEEALDNIMAKSLKEEAVAEQPKKLSKAERKAAKKLKNNEGEAATPPQDTKTAAAQANGAAADSGKKVQFAKNLEQGPTPSKANAKAEKKPEVKVDDAKKSASLGVRDVQGVSVDERKVGTGPAAKKGSKLEMRYIGKLDNGKQFDANKSGKPFSFKLGVGEVIKGWDIGLAGISAGGERRLIIPAHLAYGKKALPGIPANSKLTFDIKCLAVK